MGTTKGALGSESSKGREMRRVVRKFTTYEAVSVTTLLMTLAVVTWVLISNATLLDGTYVALIAYTCLTALLWNEAREDRLTQRRPFIGVDIDYPTQRQLTPEGVARPLPLLSIRNWGQSAAIGVKVAFDQVLPDASGQDLAQNPSLRDGIRCLLPGQRMSIRLEENFWFRLGIAAQTPYGENEEPPPPNSATVSVTTCYTDAISLRSYGETYVIDIAPHVFGWRFEAD